MRVLHIIAHLGSGGAESMLTKVIEALPQHEHVVVSFIDHGFFGSRIELAGGRVIGLGQKRSMAAALQWRRLRRLVDDVSPDLVQGWMYHGNLAASVAARGRRPVVWNVRQRLERLANNRPTTQAVILAALAYRSSVAAVIYNSTKASAEHEAWFYPREKRVVIPNGFDLDRFLPDPTAKAELRREIGASPQTRLIGRVARDDAIKDTPGLIAAFSVLQTAGVELVLIGRGMSADNASLVSLLAAHGVAKRVHLLGERVDVARYMAGFDIAVLNSSHGEGFPNVVCEAMATGTPVVATDNGECREIIGDEARIVPAGQPRMLASCLDRVLAMDEDARLMVGRRDRERVRHHYALPVIAGSYEGLWTRVCQDFARR